MTNEEAIEILKQYLDMDSEVKSEYLEAQRMAIKALEQQPKMQDCEHCIHTYGTLGCCDMVDNKWIYDCEFGKEQYKKKHELQPCEDCISREEALKVMCDKCPMYDCVTGCSSYRHIEKMPSITPKVSEHTDTLDRIIDRIEQVRDKDKLCEYPYNRCINIVKEELNGGG